MIDGAAGFGRGFHFRSGPPDGVPGDVTPQAEQSFPIDG
jgi:hypothetical protein